MICLKVNYSGIQLLQNLQQLRLMEKNTMFRWVELTFTP